MTYASRWTTSYAKSIDHQRPTARAPWTQLMLSTTTPFLRRACQRVCPRLIYCSAMAFSKNGLQARYSTLCEAEKRNETHRVISIETMLFGCRCISRSRVNTAACSLCTDAHYVINEMIPQQRSVSLLLHVEYATTPEASVKTSR